MIRTGSCATGPGGITVWYPDATRPVLVLWAEFRASDAKYRLFSYKDWRPLLEFVITDNGTRIDLGPLEPGEK